MTREFASVAEYAEYCRETCTRPAQSREDDPKFCGEISFTDEGERQYAFCGNHWGPLLDTVTQP